MSKLTEPTKDCRYSRFINAAEKAGYKVFIDGYT